MSIRLKLFLAFGAVGLLGGLIAFLAITINQAVKADVIQINQAVVIKAKDAEAMVETLLDLRLHIERLKADSNPALSASNAANAMEAIGRFETSLVSCRKASMRGVELATDEENEEEIEEAQAELVALNELDDRFRLLKDRLQLNAGTGPDRKWPVILEDYSQVVGAVRTYRNHVEDQLAIEVRNIGHAISRSSWIILLSASGALLLSAVLAWIISGTISRPVRLLARAAQRIGEGQLDTSVELRAKGELGLLARAFNRMTTDLRARAYVDDIIKSMVNTLIVVRPDGTIKSVNHSTLKLLGYTEPELLGQGMDRILETSNNGSDIVLNQLKREGSVIELETAYRTKEGKRVPVAFSASALRDQNEVFTGFVCVAQDITDRKNAEAELQRTHVELVNTSRQAGMAEVATGVLHNVGNVLNSINVSAQTIATRLGKSKIENVGRVAALMDEHASNLGDFITKDPRGKTLPGFIDKLAKNLEAEKSTILEEVDSLTKNIDHVKDIIATQQSYAKVSGLLETLKVVDIVEDAVRMNASSLIRHDVHFHREYEEGVPDVTVEKHKILQILVNLIRNAKYACDAAEREDKRLTMRIIHKDGHVQISLTDNGIGIPPENLTLIFGHGFTTKKEGHGFGLHNSAINAREMGGSLTAHSDGPGKGATFTLELPCERAA